MLKDKNINIVLAIMVAIALWAYVLGEVNPTTNLTIKNVPITYINEEALEDANRVILKNDVEAVDVTISGKRTEVTKVDKDDFSIEIDVEGLTVGENVIRLSVDGPSSVDVVDTSSDKITITVDEILTAEKDVEIKFDGKTEDGIEPYVIKAETQTVKVTGAKSIVSGISKVNAVIDVTKLGNEEKTVSASLKAVNSAGMVVSNVSLSVKKVDVTAVLRKIKTVDLNVVTKNADSKKYEVKVDAPTSVQIKGADSVLENITSISTKTIDLSAYTQDTTVEIVPILPEGVELADEATKLYANITVVKYENKSIEVGDDNIKLTNTSNDLEYEVDTHGMTLALSGLPSALKGVKISDFSITADVGGLEAGTHRVKVTIKSKKEFASMSLSTNEIKVIIK